MPFKFALRRLNADMNVNSRRPRGTADALKKPEGGMISMVPHPLVKLNWYALLGLDRSFFLSPGAQQPPLPGSVRLGASQRQDPQRVHQVDKHVEVKLLHLHAKHLPTLTAVSGQWAAGGRRQAADKLLLA